MDLVNSGNINNRIKKRTIAIAIITHLILALLTYGVSLALLVVAGPVTWLLLKKDISEANSSANSFNRNCPFGYFGRTFGSFQHVFYHSYSIEKDIYQAIEDALKAKTPIASVKAVSIIDTDPFLKNCEQRSFIKAEFDPNSRGTATTLLLNYTSFGSMRTIQWRVLAGGYIDKNAQFNLIAYSLFTIFIWVGPYLKDGHDLLSRVRTIYPSTYNHMDIESQVRCLHEVVFDAMTAELEKNGIDTTELKVQRMQAIHINITDGKVTVPSALRGAIKKFGGTARGARA